MSTNTKSTPKGASRKSRIITLNLSSSLLEKFPHASNIKPSSSTAASKAIKVEATPSIAAPTPVKDDKSPSSNATPVPGASEQTPDPNSLAPPPKVDGRRKRGGGTAGAVSGRKRAPPTIDPNAPPRERGRPGPKKKPRLPDGTIDRSADPTKPPGTTGTPSGAPAPIPAHKLGPKANTGAINAGLRALDRSGKPCRRWEKRGLQLKSFTGMAWSMSSWKAPSKTVGLDGDGETKSDSSSLGESGEGRNGAKEEVGGSSAVDNGSERSISGGVADADADGDVSMGGLESSPAPVGVAA